MGNWEVRNDSYQNLLTGVGSHNDATIMNTFSANPLLDVASLTAIFRSDGIGRRLVQRPALDMCREWFTIDSANGEKVLDQLETLRARPKFIEGVLQARLYGGSLMVAVTDEDLASYETPYSGADIVGLKVFGREHVTFDVNTESSDPMLLLEGLPEFYLVSVPGSSAARNRGAQIRVHESRCRVFQGAYVPDSARTFNGGWGDSVLQAAWDALSRFGTAQGYTANIMKEFSQSVLSVKGLTNLILAGKTDTVIERLRLLDMSKSILNTMVIDADGEEYDRNSSSVAGLPEMLDRFSEVLSACSDMPLTVLLGRSPAGMDATGDSDLQIYYDGLKSEQERVLSPVAEWLIELLMGTSGPSAWSVRWNPLKQETEKELAEVRKVVADTDAIYIGQGVLSADEVAQSRFGTGAWSMETHLIEGTDRSEEASNDDPPPAPLVPGLVPGQDPQAGTPPEDPNNRTDADPRTLYVSRAVMNRSDFERWAEQQGVTLQDDLHVTVVHSNTPVDWFAMGSDYGDDKGQLLIPPGGPRALDVFGLANDTVVLEFASEHLTWRRGRLLEAGASSDFEEYRPHISLFSGTTVPEGVTPYQGVILLGPEIFEEVE